MEIFPEVEKPKDILLEDVLQQGRSQDFRRIAARSRTEREWGARQRADWATAGVWGRSPRIFYGKFYFLECIFTIEFTFLLLKMILLKMVLYTSYWLPNTYQFSYFEILNLTDFFLEN